MRLAAVLMALTLAMTTARPLGAKTASGWSVTLEAVTDVPLNAGARLQLETPLRLRLGTTLGGVPPGYIDLVNAIVVAADGYDVATARIVASALRRSVVWRTHFGWRPFARHGFYIEAGYGLVSLHGGVAGDSLISLDLERDESLDVVRTIRPYEIDTTLHMLDVEIGWQWLLWKRLVLRVALGLSLTLGTETDVGSGGRPYNSRRADPFDREVERWLDSVYASFAHVPTLSFAVGYRF